MKFLSAFLLLSCAKSPQPSVELKTKHCPKAYVEYRNGTVYHPQDAIQIGVAAKRCGQLYRNGPCIVKVIKVGDFDYHAICGAPR